jgi:hypothetical protein
VQVDIHTERREQGQVVEQHPEASFRVRIRTGPEGRSRDVKVLDGLLNSVPPKAHSGETWEWELGPGLYAYCYAGDEVHFLALMGEGEEIDVQL